MGKNRRMAFIQGKIEQGKQLKKDAQFAKNIATVVNASIAQVLITDYDFTEKEVQEVLFKAMELARENVANDLPKKKPLKPTPVRGNTGETLH